jgi:hypothetical protein
MPSEQEAQVAVSGGAPTPLELDALAEQAKPAKTSAAKKAPAKRGSRTTG